MNRKWVVNNEGLAFYNEPKTVEDYISLGNAISSAPDSRYPVGMSACFVAGMNGDWKNGVCPIYRLDKKECTCKDMHEEFERILEAEQVSSEKGKNGNV